MPRYASRTVVLTCTLAFLLAAAGFAQNSSVAPATQEAVATVAGETITAIQLREAIGGKAIVAETMAYQTRRTALEELIARRLVVKEAQRRSVSPEQLEKDEIDGKVRELTDDEARLVYAAAPQMFGSRSETDAVPVVKEQVRRQRLAARRVEFALELRRSYPVKLLLEPPRTAVELSDTLHVSGPADAPVTIVEFSDFQCPFCARMSPVLARVRSAYPNDVRIVFKHFPLPSHDQAVPAALAAECAGEAGKFWDMKRVLFENQARLGDASFQQLAATLKLNPDDFSDCMTSRRHSQRVERDQADGIRLGVGSTPTVFLNGRLVSGAQPYEVVAAMVTEELEKTKARGSERQ